MGAWEHGAMIENYSSYWMPKAWETTYTPIEYEHTILSLKPSHGVEKNRRRGLGQLKRKSCSVADHLVNENRKIIILLNRPQRNPHINILHVHSTSEPASSTQNIYEKGGHVSAQRNCLKLFSTSRRRISPRAFGKEDVPPVQPSFSLRYHNPSCLCSSMSERDFSKQWNWHGMITIIL